MALRPILEVCDRETVNEGGGRRHEPWWWETAARKQLNAKLEDILVAARAWRWGSGRRGEGGEGRKVLESDAGSELYWYDGWRQVAPGWADDIMWRHNGCQKI